MRLDRPLDDLFATGSHVCVLRALAHVPEDFPASARELGRRADVAHPTASRVLAGLRDQGAVLVERTPRADLYRLNRDHVLVEFLLELFEREEAARDELVSFLQNQIQRHAPFLTIALIFGSAAEGDMSPSSDIDLAVACPPERLDDVEAAMEPVERAVRRRFGNRLAVLVRPEPLGDLTKRGRAGARLWKQVLLQGIPVVGSLGDRARDA